MLGVKRICFLEERRGTFYDIGISSEILSIILRIKVIKLKLGKVDYIKIKGFGILKGIINRVESSIILE